MVRSRNGGVELAPPYFLQLAGHPVRWQLLSELARSDRMVHELTALVAQPQNLVSYHLGKLRTAKLVRARRSSADGRDSYYTADLGHLGDLLSATGTALHPALGPPPTAADPTAPPTRVLFLCTGNSGRSPMAAALLRSRSHGRVETCSAGSHPKPLRDEAVAVLRDGYGIDIADHRPTHLDEYIEQRFDWVISLCDRVREICPDPIGAPCTVHWSIADPAAEPADDDEGRYAAFERTATELDSRIRFLLGALTRPGSRSDNSEEEP